MKKENLSKSILTNIKEGIEDKNYAEWKKVCEVFCKKIGAELLFVNSNNFGYEDKDGNLIHMYADELAEYLKSMGEDLKEAYVEKKDNVDIEELAREIMSLIELYDEDKMNSGDDVFAGTEDAYAEEVFEQNLYSALLYSGLFHIESLQQEIENPTEDGSKLDSLYNKIIEIVEYGDAFKGKTENLVNYLNSVLKESINEAVDEHKYTLSNCIKQIKAIDDPKGFYNKVREIIGYNDEEWNERYGWEDHEIKRLQREADARYEELKGTLDESIDTDIKAEKEKMLHVGRQKAVLKALKNAKEHLAKDDDYYLKKDSTARFNYENLVSTIDDTISRVEKFQKDIDKLEESFQVNGTAYVTLWDGDTGTIEMKPYNIEEITPEAICQGANDNGFGVKEITGVKASVDGEDYEFFDDEFKKYSEGKEKKGIQIPKADLGEIKDIEYYCLYTSRENYPVIKVNDKYLITRAGTNDFSGQWRLEGFLPFRMYNYGNLIKPDVALGIKDWLLKNGNSKYKVVDYDHGSTRIWSGSPRYLLTGFTPADPEFFKRLTGGKDSVVIEGKEYKINDNIEESVKDRNVDFVIYRRTSEGPLYISGRSTTFKKEEAIKFPTEEEAKEYLHEYMENVVDHEAPNFIIGKLNELNEAVHPDQNYIGFLKDGLGDTYQEEETDNYLIVRGKRHDLPIVALWYGRAQRPQIYSSFRSEEDREKYIQNFLNNKASDEEAKAKRKEERKLTRDHDIKVGDIFYTSWGYDQTNIDFYEVVNVRGSRIDLKEIGHKYIERGDGGYPDLIEPVPGSYINDNIITVSARADGTVTSISSFEYPSLWDGKPKYQTNPYSGH